jgi:hypothetical protein
VLHDGRSAAHERTLTPRGLYSALVAAPIIALCVGVFLATLLPAVYVMLPVFLAVHIASQARPGIPDPLPLPSRHRPTPAYG